MMQVLIDQTNKREIADWLLQKSLPIILCNSIISTIEVHPCFITQICPSTNNFSRSIEQKNTLISSS